MNRSNLTRIAFGIIVVILAFNAFMSLFMFIFHNVFSPFFNEDLGITSVDNSMADAFAAQFLGYRLAIFVVSVIALISNKASHIYIISLGILVLSLYQLSYMLFHGFYELQAIVAALFIFLSGYCFFNTKSSEVNNA